MLPTLWDKPGKCCAANLPDKEHDGDMTSANYVMGNESIKELSNLLDKASTYLSPQGGLKSSMDYYTTELVTHNMSRR